MPQLPAAAADPESSAATLPQLLLLGGRQALEPGIILQRALLFRGRHVFVVPQPVAGMTAPLRTPWWPALRWSSPLRAGRLIRIRSRRGCALCLIGPALPLPPWMEKTVEPKTGIGCRDCDRHGGHR